MSVFGWCSRRLGGLSMVALVILCYWVISDEAARIRNGSHEKRASSSQNESQPSPDASGATVWTYIFAYYTLFVHCALMGFPLRACYAVLNLSRSLIRNKTGGSLKDYKSKALRRRGSCTSVSSSETLTSENHGTSSSASSDAGDVETETYTDYTGTPSPGPIVHAVVIPNYKEEVDSLKETLEVLASHPQAQSSYDIYLAMEQREQGGESKALALIQEFVKKFRSIDYTVHPSDIPGEAAGKGSNMAWAARKLSAKYPADGRKNVVVTGLDADSHLSSNYFTHLTDMHLSHPETAPTTLYAAPIIFDRNAHAVPAIVRVADILWSAGGMSGLYRGSSIAPPTSVYSLSLDLIDRVGGWDGDCEAIGEDLHMYIKCFFALNGNLTCRTILSPVSQSNVVGSGKGGLRGVLLDVRARYKQALRHMWGSLDTGFALRKFVQMWQNRRQTTRAYRPLHRSSGDTSGVYFPESQPTVSDALDVSENGVFSDVTQGILQEPHWENVFYIGHRLYEAHILPVHMTILIIASTLYMWVTESQGDPYGIAWIFSFANVVRTVGFMIIAGYIFLYERFHRICVDNREREMKDAGLYEGMCFSRRSFRQNLVDYVMVPLVAPLYGAIPCVQAELSHFYTLDLVYTVSKKVTRQQPRNDADVADMA